MRSTILALALFAAGCRPDTTNTATSDLRASPAALQFGDVAMGASVPLTFELDNAGQAPAEATLSIDGPFTLSGTSASLSGGASTSFTVTFAPMALGAAMGAVHIADAGTVALTGNGLPACVSTKPCASSTFDLTTRACVETPLGEGTACSAPCLSGAGSCRGGFCVGTASSCVDADACTLDVCTSDGGCLNPPLTCPVTDPCLAQFCDSATGCGSQPVQDGTPCGDATCEAAHVCLSGVCTLKTRPNAATDCRYTALAAGANYACAVTRGGDLRCWGDNSGDELARGFPSALAPPGFAMGLGPVRAVASGGAGNWISRPSADLACTNSTATLAIDATQLTVGANVCGIDHSDVRCGDATGGAVTTIDTNAIALSMSYARLCVLHADGGTPCQPLPSPATDIATAWGDGGCAMLDEGRVYCWGQTLTGAGAIVWDGGATAMGLSPWYAFSNDPPMCVGTDAGIHCLNFSAGDPLVMDAVTPPVQSLALGMFHACALHDDATVSCWGANNQFGQLGERSAQPLGVQPFFTQADWLGTFDGDFLFASAGSRVQGITVVVRTDAGVQWGQPAPTITNGSPASLNAGCPCGFDAGPCSSHWAPISVDEPMRCARDNTGALCVSGPGGVVTCYQNGNTLSDQWDAGGDVAALATEGYPSGLCAVRTDGTVVCHEPMMGQPNIASSLTGVKDLCFGDPMANEGCARLETGELRCWGDWVGSATPKVPDGAWPTSRQLTCGYHHFCALSGINIVRCWGANDHGQLGHDGPPVTVAADVPMPGPVTSIVAGHDHTCALLASRDVVCWGDNEFGQLGRPILMSTRVPLVVSQ
jgi:hypothetical protein